MVFFQVAYTSFLPELFTDQTNLQSSNSKLFFSESITRTIGPMMAGPLISIFGVITTIAINAVTFVLSVLSLISMKHKSVKIERKPRESGWLRKDIIEGLRFIIKNPKLEPVIFCGVVYVLFLSMIESSLVIYCYDVLDLSITNIGLVIGATTLGFPIGNINLNNIRFKL